MFNKFIIVGPKKDPARIKGSKKIDDAFLKIYNSTKKNKGIKFISRGDNSGTHFRELVIWKNIGKSLDKYNYIEAGSGQGATLNIASAMNQYSLSDSATWAAFKNKGELVKLVVDDRPINQYSVLLINKEKHKNLNHVAANKIKNWFISKVGQNKINSYKINQKQVFFANAE